MKRNFNLLLVITMLSAMLVFLSACGTGSKDSAVDSFLNRIKTVSQENPELSGYSISGLTEEGSGTYSANAIIDGETIGAISISVYNKQITELSFSFFGDVAIGKNMQAVIASAMAIDSTLDYSTAKEIVSDTVSALFFHLGQVENNGYAYSGQYEDNLLFIKISKMMD